MVRSMTGFGRGVTTTKSYQLTIEVRAVNHRFLEISTKFPKEWMESEVLAKKMLSTAVSRGKLDVLIAVKELQVEEQHVTINWALLEAYIKAKEALSQKIAMQEKWSMQEIAMLDQVLVVEKQEAMQEDFLIAVERAMQEAIENLVQMREREGQELKLVMLQYKEQLQQQIAQIRATSPDAVMKYRERLKARIEEIASGQLLEERLLMEVALFAERVDITEELDRLDSHFGQLEEILQEHGAIGRKLDFLMQEMHREINTIGSKNQSSESSVAVVQAKAILEKMREQVQNIE
ncbi:MULTISPECIES: YicC/YloC family endoribonuclease [Bacillales]|uniref:YicC/YloC family endoribonuclease n=1 Tax=Lysinibacillus louembei TaxID=1470088 RepID=A0ABZ0RUU6_9BACI|nr:MULTISPECIES: YicC/YloC family endoribonuclease [Bacillales]MCT6924049.1 YicC family protein [Metasolibacillus sp.]MCT6940093.1 YicC family protein [Metasolibacillus sp.]WPK12009.1 YicC/YloC family endoribonuclease [Lysinibacillus louembei]